MVSEMHALHNRKTSHRETKVTEKKSHGNKSHMLNASVSRPNEQQYSKKNYA